MPNDHPRFGFDYRSRAELLGIPWIHVTSGWDPETGRSRCARGIIAIGPRAIGGLAMGGAALGLFSLGGVSMGLFSLGGCSVGLLLALGGVAVGAGISAGGMAVGLVALGGCAVGLLAVGGAAFGVYRMGGNVPGGRNFSELGFEFPANAGFWPGGPGFPGRQSIPPGGMMPEGGTEVVSMGLTLSMLVLLLLFTLAMLSVFVAIVAGLVAGNQAKRRMSDESTGVKLTKSEVPHEYRPPVILKKDLESSRDQVYSDGPEQSGALQRMLLATILSALLVAFLLFPRLSLLGAKGPILLLLVLLLGVVVWSAMKSRGCAIALGIGISLLAVVGLLAVGYLVSFSTDVRETDPAVVQEGRVIQLDDTLPAESDDLEEDP